MQERLLILYNPYYQHDVIYSHLQILKERGSVAFGKLKSRLRNESSSQTHNPQESLQHLVEQVSHATPLQLFLTDYANLYVCKVIEISSARKGYAPSYYEEKELEVELWFLISDMRELVRNDFVNVRDNFLSHFITAHNERTFALYGNDYTYPLCVRDKRDMEYFTEVDMMGEPIIYHHDMFKTEAQITKRSHLILYIFGAKLFYYMRQDSMENLINAEIEYEANCANPLHDCTGIVMLYGKVIEQELARFMRALFRTLLHFSQEYMTDSALLATYTYSTQGREAKLCDWLDKRASVRPNFGTYKSLINDSKEIIKQWANGGANEILKHNERYYRKQIQLFVAHKLLSGIDSVQKVRNATAHEITPRTEQATHLRKQILGIGYDSLLVSMIRWLRFLETH